MTTEEIKNYIIQRFGTGKEGAEALAIAQSESNFNANAEYQPRNSSEHSIGVFQINTDRRYWEERKRKYRLSSREDLKDPKKNIDIAYRMSGGGKNWKPWSTYNTPKYQHNLIKAREYIQKYRAGGGASGPPAAADAAAPPGLSVSINGIAATAAIAAALTTAGIALVPASGEQSKLQYQGNVWCVSNWVSEEDESGQKVLLPDGRERRDRRLDGKEDWLRRQQVQANSKEEAEKNATISGIFEPSDKTLLRAALDKNDETGKDYFIHHFNTGATAAGPCWGSGDADNPAPGMWVNDMIREEKPNDPNLPAAGPSYGQDFTAQIAQNYAREQNEYANAFAGGGYANPASGPIQITGNGMCALPIPGNRHITSGLEAQRGNSKHRGWDFAASTGTNVVAVMDGIIIKSEDRWEDQSGNHWGKRNQNGGFGNRIVIRHSNGRYSEYHHLSHGSLLPVNTRVNKGQPIGRVDNTGWSSGPHLHFQMMNSPDYHDFIDPAFCFR